MKYQIYLNKNTSAIVDRIAKDTDQKPATIIKSLVERLIEVAASEEGLIITDTTYSILNAEANMKGQ